VVWSSPITDPNVKMNKGIKKDNAIEVSFISK
jgi:hypothetical protein